MKGLQHHKRMGFKHSAIHAKREPHASYYLKRKASFWIATFSVLAFLTGNMMAQHGWYAFWASVIGQEDDSVIAYAGTAKPLKQIVDYGCWATFGGDYKAHTFRQVPQDCLRRMPDYHAGTVNDEVFSMEYMSSYGRTTEDSGTHAGVDIRVPVGTPVQAVMNARVFKTGNQPDGYGMYVVLKHPNVPGPTGMTTTLYSTYAHLSAVYVEDGAIVHRGEDVGLSGVSGQVTGPHLHFQMDNEAVPYLPYFPDTMEHGYAYTVNPLTYVQSHQYDSFSVVVALGDDAVELSPDIVPRRLRVAEQSSRTAVALSSSSRSFALPETSKSIIARLQMRREERLKERIALQRNRETVVVLHAFQPGLIPPSHQSALPLLAPQIGAERTVVQNSPGDVETVEIAHDGTFSGRGWEKVLIRLLDADGNAVVSPDLNFDIELRANFGVAEFRPSTLSPLDFQRGEAFVNVLPRGKTTLVIQAMPYNVIAEPMAFER